MKIIIFIAFPLSPSNPPNPKTYNVEVVTDLIQTSNGVRASEMCSAPVVNVKGKLVLLTRGSCSIYEKSQFLEKAGAIGFIVANNKPGDIGPLSPLSIIPIYTISEVDGIYLASILTQSNQIASFSSKDQTFDLPSGGSLSKFSTWGLGPELEIKPDFGAPGGYIYSSYPKAKGSYAVLSGTSMSTPYIAGCYALYLEYLQSQSTKSTKYQYNVIDIRDVFSLYSSAIDTRDQTQDSSISVARQGGGLIQIDRALLGTTYVTPAKLSIGLLPMSQPVVFTIYNNGNTTRQYQFVLITAPTIDITNSTNPRTLNSSSNIRFSEDGVSFSEKLSVTIKNQDSVQIYCMVDGDADVSIDQGGQYLLSGFIEIIPTSLQDDMYQSQTGDYVMSVPFAGLIADLTKQVIFETGTNGIKVKWMRGSDKTMVKGSNGSINVMDFIPGDNIVIQWRLLVPLQSVSVDVYGIDGNLLGNVMNTERQQRNSGKVDNLTNYFTTVRWDMTVTDATGELTVLANGSYTLGLTYTTVTMIGSNAGITQTLSLTNLIVSSSNQVDSV